MPVIFLKIRIFVQDTITPVCLLIIASTSMFSYMGFVRYGFLGQYIFDIQAILRDKQFYRIFTCALLHGSWAHLIFNMLTLYFFGVDIEKQYGVIPFLAIYLSGILGGSLVSLILHRNHVYRALGASGGVCGIIFASIFLFPGSSIYLFFVPVPIPAEVYAIGFMLYSYFGLRGQRDNIGHDAHLGGAIVSLLVTTAMYPVIVPQNPMLYPVVLILALIFLFLLYLKPIYMHHTSTSFKAYIPKKKKEDKLDVLKNEEPTDNEILNELLDKVSKSGINSLTYVERQQLERISKSKQQQ